MALGVLCSRYLYRFRMKWEVKLSLHFGIFSFCVCHYCLFCFGLFVFYSRMLFWKNRNYCWVGCSGSCSSAQMQDKGNENDVWVPVSTVEQTDVSSDDWQHLKTVNGRSFQLLSSAKLKWFCRCIRLCISSLAHLSSAFWEDYSLFQKQDIADQLTDGVLL